MTMQHTGFTPLVKATADRYDVDLATVTGTGVGGRVTVTDVHAAASRAGAGRLPAATPPPGSAPLSPADARNLAQRLGVNPDAVHGTGPGGTITAADVHRQAGASRDGLTYRPGALDTSSPADPYRASAQMPAFTASGVDPRDLLAVPSAVRGALAAVPDRADVRRIAARYIGLTEAQAQARFAEDSELQQHETRASATYTGWPGPWS